MEILVSSSISGLLRFVVTDRKFLWLLTSSSSIVLSHDTVDADGKYVASAEPKSADWFIQSLCSAHLEEKHQWGEGIGLEDDIFITNEEWQNYALDESFVGIGVHVLDIENKALHAVGSFSQGGFEKNVEINSQHPDYVIFAVSGKMKLPE